MSGWNDILQKTTVKHLIINKKPLVAVKDNHSLRDTLKVLAEKNILSVPVLDHVSGNFIGFVDVLDISGYVLSFWSKNLPRWKSHHFPSSDFFNSEVRSVLNFSGVDTPAAVDEHTTLKDLIKIFNQPQKHHHHHLHRVAVASNGVIVNILSQSDVVTFLYANLENLPISNQPVANLITTHHPIVVRVDTPFVEALELLYRNRVTGIALVDESFHLDGNLSASDLRGIIPFSFDAFDHSVLQFLAKGTKTGLAGPSVTCAPGSPLRDVITSLVTQQVHRAYVVDDNNRPLGVISMSDIIAVIGASI